MDDLLTYIGRIKLLGTPSFYVHREVPPTFAYPPGAAYLYKGIYSTPHFKVAFLLLGVLYLAALPLCFSSLLRAALSGTQRLLVAASVLLLSYPLVFTMERGNIELFICLLSTVGICQFWRGRFYSAAVLLGLAGCIKPFPLLLLGIFLTRRPQWRPLMLAVATAALATLGCLWLAGPSCKDAAVGFLSGMTNIESGRAATGFRGGMMFDHSLFSPLKAIALLADAQVRPLLDMYYAGVGLALLWGGWRVASYPAVNRLAFYSVAAVSVAPISYEYTVADCYPLLLLVAATSFTIEHKRALRKFECCVLGVTTLLFLPFTLYGGGETAFGGQVEAVLFLCLLFLASVRPWSRPLGQGALQAASFHPTASGLLETR